MTDSITSVATCSHCATVGPISSDATAAYGEATCRRCWETPEYCQSCGNVHPYSDPTCPPCHTCGTVHDSDEPCADDPDGWDEYAQAECIAAERGAATYFFGSDER